MRMDEGRQRVTIVGAGSWGTTLSLLVARAGHRPTLYVRDADHAALIMRSGRNPRSLPDLALAPELVVSSDLAAACDGATLILLVVPSQAMREAARAVAQCAG